MVGCQWFVRSAAGAAAMQQQFQLVSCRLIGRHHSVGDDAAGLRSRRIINDASASLSSVIVIITRCTVGRSGQQSGGRQAVGGGPVQRAAGGGSAAAREGPATGAGRCFGRGRLRRGRVDREAAMRGLQKAGGQHRMLSRSAVWWPGWVQHLAGSVAEAAGRRAQCPPPGRPEE